MLHDAELSVAELKRWMREYTPRLLAVVEPYASGPVEAEDLLQEVWVRAHRNALARAPDVPVHAWLIVIALNVGRDHQRRTRRRERLRKMWGWLAASSPPAPPELREIHPRSRLWVSVARLPELQRQVLILRIVEEMSTAEVARALARAEGTIKVSLFRALETLRREWTAELTAGPSGAATIVEEVR